MQMFIAIALFILGLLILIVGGEFLVRGSESIAAQHIQSLLCVPIHVAGQLHGAEADPVTQIEVIEAVSRADGRVFELAIPPGGDETRLAGAEIVSRTRDGEGTRIRAVSSDGSLPEGGRPVEHPTLEEGYLAFMAARGRAEAVVAEEER